MSVTRKSAPPSSAHAQNGSSAGSGETFVFARGTADSASSHSRLMSSPMVSRRTFNRRRTALHSVRISSETIHVKLPRSSQSRSKWALGFDDKTPPLRNPQSACEPFGPTPDEAQWKQKDAERSTKWRWTRTGFRRMSFGFHDSTPSLQRDCGPAGRASGGPATDGLCAKRAVPGHALRNNHDPCTGEC